MLRRLAWSSIPSSSFSSAHLDQIIAPARRNNERTHVSGMLLFTGAHFLALYEGEERDLRELWARLERDRRHRDLSRIDDHPCVKRLYAKWMMGYLVDSKVDVQIESLHSLQLRVDEDHARAGARAEAARFLQPWPTPAWQRVIQPIMERADSM